jgi:hemoglobin
MKHDRRVRALIVAAVIGVIAVAASTAGVAQEAKPTLYKRLGGYDAIAAVTDDFLLRLTSDPSLARFFGGHGNDSRAKIRQLLVDQLCAATGGPCVYIGRDMKTVHDGLGITDADWDAMVKHLKASLDKFKVAKAEQDDTLAAIGGLKKDIVAPKQ